MSFIEILLGSPASRLTLPGESHWPLFCELIHRVDARGDLIQDAYLAALALEQGCEWVTSDRDFARFPSLRVAFI